MVKIKLATSIFVGLFVLSTSIAKAKSKQKTHWELGTSIGITNVHFNSDGVKRVYTPLPSNHTNLGFGIGLTPNSRVTLLISNVVSNSRSNELNHQLRFDEVFFAPVFETRLGKQSNFVLSLGPRIGWLYSARSEHSITSNYVSPQFTDLNYGVFSRLAYVPKVSGDVNILPFIGVGSILTNMEGDDAALNQSTKKTNFELGLTFKLAQRQGKSELIIEDEDAKN